MKAEMPSLHLPFSYLVSPSEDSMLGCSVVVCLFEALKKKGKGSFKELSHEGAS